MSINRLERPESEKELFIYRFPLLNSTIDMGAKLVVGQDEAAVLVKDGRVYDVFPKGEYDLDTTTMPLLTKGLSLKKHGHFVCDVYFISLYTYKNLKWAMINSVVVRDNTFGSVSL